MPETTTAPKERTILGSGHLYAKVFEGELPEMSVLEAEANLLGYISGGATLEYKPSYYTAKDDLGYIKKTIMTDEEVTLKSGIMTLNGNTIAKMSSTARVTENGTKRTVKIGGIKNDTRKRYVILFVYKDAEAGDIRIMIVGSNQAGFTFAFTKDKETVIDAEFKAEPMDGEGTLVVFEETAPASAGTEG